MLSILVVIGCSGLITKSRPHLPSDTSTQAQELARHTGSPYQVFEELNGYFSSNDWSSAENLVDEVRQRVLDGAWTNDDKFQLNLFAAKIALNLNRANVDDLLLNIRARTVEQRIELNSLWVEALVSRGQLVQATNIATKADLGFNDAQTRSDYVWSIVSKSAPFNVHNYLELVNDDEVEGWWELARLYQESLSDPSWNRSWTQWRDTHQAHPAQNFPPTELLQQANSIHQLAVLLPQSGPLADAAIPIRDGIISAYQADNNLRTETEQSSVVFLDTTNQDIPTLIHSAFRNGAEAVIGPLSKQNVEDAMMEREYPGPVLLLNHVGIGTRPNYELRQLALSVEDEAIFHAEFLRERQKNRLLLIYGDSLWSSRCMFAFVARTEPKSNIVDVASLSDLATVTETVAGLLDVDESTIRRERVATTTRLDLEFTARRRQDIDAIVAFVDAAEFEALTAALRYHFADDIDLYVTEAAVRDAPPNEEADGVKFSASPWLVYTTPMRNRIQSVFDPSSEAFSLYALGIDAYRIINRWELYRGQNAIGGETGYYHLDSDGTVRRTPVWGIVADGKLKPFNSHESTFKKEIPLL